MITTLLAIQKGAVALIFLTVKQENWGFLERNLHSIALKVPRFWLNWCRLGINLVPQDESNCTLFKMLIRHSSRRLSRPNASQTGCGLRSGRASTHCPAQRHKGEVRHPYTL